MLCQTDRNIAIRTRIDVADTDTVPDYLLMVMVAGFELVGLIRRMMG